jgi:ferredoxin-NADP reductase
VSTAESPSDQATTVRVAGKRTAADGVVTLALEAPDGGRLPDWTPGAHIDLILPHGVTRQYSLCGDRWDAHSYRIGVLRERDGRGGSAYVHDRLAPGDVVGIGGPRNNFPLLPATEYRFIAGGIGITPLLPMIRQAELVGAGWRLLYGGRTRTSMAFLDELGHHGDRVEVVPQDERGLLDIAAFLGEPRDGLQVYCCGPASLLTALATVTEAWPAHSVHIERFVARELGSPARNDAFTVVLATSKRIVTVSPQQTVLDAVRRAGVDVLSSCRQGTCGTCETGVLEGQPDHRDSILDDVERTAGDCMFLCVSRSRTDRLVLDL